MRSKKGFNLNISFIRCIFCIAVLLYHLNILKGGYLAVCSFFVLTGYFSAISLNNYKLTKYYFNRFKKIYIPLIIVVFSSVGLLSILNINVFNLKPEINSILLGYNNYFQINANIDYFAKQTSSLFIHLWYISILMQIELIFPIIFKIINNVGKKINKSVPFIIMLIISIIGTVYFYNNSLNKNMMFTYYDTISRLFSFTFGVTLGLYHIKNHYEIKFKPKNKIIMFIIFMFYLISLCTLFLTIQSTSKLFAIAMILTTIITIRLIDYATLLFKNNIIINNKIFNFISDISYEIYLVQYPVIFFMNQLKINNILRLISIILITIFISWIIHISIKISKKHKIRFLLQFLVFAFVIYGGYKYITMKNYTKEINNIKNVLNDNEKLMKQKQEEYNKRKKEKEEEWNEYVKSINKTPEEILEYVTNLKVIGIGDSIMQNAIPGLYEEFPNGYFDAKVSRSTCASYEVLKSIKDKGVESDILIFNLGTNDTPNRTCKDNLMSLAGDNKVFWLTATHPDDETSNSELVKYAKDFENIYVLDWVEIANKHHEYLYSDETHLKPEGLEPYVKFIKNEIYKIYLEEYNSNKNDIINEHEKEEKDNITFYGDELLINIFENLEKEFPEAKFEAEKDLKYNNLLTKLKDDTKNNKLSDKLVFVFNKDNSFTKKQYEKIINILKDKNIYIITFNSLKINNDKIKIIKIKNDKSFFFKDNINLTNKGKNNLTKELISAIKN